MLPKAKQATTERQKDKRECRVTLISLEPFSLQIVPHQCGGKKRRVWRKSKNLGSMMMGFDLAQLRKVIFGLFLVFYTEEQTFGVRQTDRWLSRRFIFLCQTWATFTLRHKHTLLSWYIMSPWKNSYGVKLKEGSFSRCGFYATKRLIKDNIQKVPPLCLWSYWSGTPSYRACGESWFSPFSCSLSPKNWVFLSK